VKPVPNSRQYWIKATDAEGPGDSVIPAPGNQGGFQGGMVGAEQAVAGSVQVSSLSSITRAALIVTTEKWHDFHLSGKTELGMAQRKRS
jgi:hypothetical protein